VSVASGWDQLSFQARGVLGAKADCGLPCSAIIKATQIKIYTNMEKIVSEIKVAKDLLENSALYKGAKGVVNSADFQESEFEGRKYATLCGYSWRALKQVGAQQFVRFYTDEKNKRMVELQPFSFVINKVSEQTATNRDGQEYNRKVYEGECTAL
jgi:hypothetical protein